LELPPESNCDWGAGSAEFSQAVKSAVRLAIRRKLLNRFFIVVWG
jgi:hypothetical protein